MRTAFEALRITQSFNDIGFSTHRSGDNTNLTFIGTRSSFSVHNHILIEMVLPGCIVVGNINHRLKVRFRFHCLDGFTNTGHHQLTVGKGKGHTVVHFTEIILCHLRLHWQVSQSRYHFRIPFLIPILRNLIIVIGNLQTNITASGVNHHPHIRRFGIFLNLNKVVSSSQGSYLLQTSLVLILQYRHLLKVESLWK